MLMNKVKTPVLKVQNVNSNLTHVGSKLDLYYYTLNIIAFIKYLTRILQNYYKLNIIKFVKYLIRILY